MLKTLLRLSPIFLMLVLQGCTAVVATTAMVGADMASDRRTAGMYIEDQRIEIDARSALNEVAEIAEQSELSVTSFNRLVLITGQSPNPALKNRATAIVRKIANVRKVHNEVRVKAPSTFMSGTNDAWLTTKTKSLLLAEKDLSSHHVKVITENGEVFLMGLVSREEANKAIAVVREIDGVERVVEVFEYMN